MALDAVEALDALEDEVSKEKHRDGGKGLGEEMSSLRTSVRGGAPLDKGNVQDVYSSPVVETKLSQESPGSTSKRTTYGHIRAYSSLAWAVCCVGTGLLMDLGDPSGSAGEVPTDPDPATPVLGVAAFGFAGCLLLMLACYSGSQKRTEGERRAPDAEVLAGESEKTRPSASSDTTNRSGGYERKTIFSSRVLCFLFSLTVYGVFKTGSEQYLFLFLRNDEDFEPVAPHWVLGAAVTTMGLAEALVFRHEDRLRTMIVTHFSRRLEVFPRTADQDHHVVFVFCGCMLSLRYLLYAALPRHLPGLVLLVEPLHGLTYALMFGGAVRRARELAAGGSGADDTLLQAWALAAYTQIGMGAGNLLWGAVLDVFPFRPVFETAALLLAGWFLCFTFCWGRATSRSDDRDHDDVGGSGAYQFVSS